MVHILSADPQKSRGRFHKEFNEETEEIAGLKSKREPLN